MIRQHCRRPFTHLRPLLRPGPDGLAIFSEAGAPATMTTPGVVDLAWMWAVAGGHTSPRGIGSAASVGRMPGPDGSAFGVVRFPANSAGKLAVSDLLPDSADGGQEGNAAMHATETIDYETILSGKIDNVLPGNQGRTLKPGDLLVMVYLTPGRTSTVRTASMCSSSSVPGARA